MPVISFNHITKSYGVTSALRDFNLTVNDGELMVIVGPSGCGKSTLLRMLAGLEEPTGGSFLMDGRVLNALPPKERDIAMVFQNHALYPHMTAAENLGFALRLRGGTKREIAERVTATAELLGISALLDRKPRELSGGECQRVALGRALIRRPKLFLFDEPLSNLDAPARMSLRTEILRLHRQLGATMLYVTHDQSEAMTMGDRICLMRAGAIEQVGTPAELYNRPQSRFAASFIGSPPAHFLTVRYSNRMLCHSAFTIQAPECLAGRCSEGDKISLGLRPEHFREGGELRFNALVEFVEPAGAVNLVHLTLNNERLIAALPPGCTCTPGESRQFSADLKQALFFDPASGDRVPNHEQ